MVKQFGLRLLAVGVTALALAVAAPAGAVDSGPLHWHTPQRVDPFRGGLTSVSCVSPTFCLAGDHTGAVFEYDGQRWTEQAQVDADRGRIVALTCVSRSFCVAAVDSRHGKSRPLLYQDGRWRAAGRFVAVGGARSSSCVGARFCLIVNRDGSFETYDGTSWTTPHRVSPDASRLATVSCVTASYCLAGSATGDIFGFDGARWSGPNRIDAGHAITGLSCPSAEWCMAVDGSGRALRHTVGRWHPAQQFDPRAGGHETLDCPRVGYCVAVDGTAKGFAYTHGAWHGGRAVAQPSIVDDVSCSRPGFCIAVTRAGQISRKGRGFWAQKWVDPVFGFAQDLSCGSARSCVVIDAHGGWLRYDATAWSAPKRGPYARQLPLRFLSCPSADFCMGMTLSGRPARLINGSWGRATRPAGFQLAAGLSCRSKTMCIAVGADWSAVYDGRHWHAARVPGVIDLTSVSCAARFCLATNYDGSVVRYRDGAWSAPMQLHRSGTVSCATAFCLAYDSDGRASRFESGAWTPTGRIFGGRQAVIDVSCTSRTFCVAVSATSETTYDGRRWSRPAHIVPAGSDLVSVSCVARSLCAAVSARDGRAVVAS